MGDLVYYLVYYCVTILGIVTWKPSDQCLCISLESPKVSDDSFIPSPFVLKCALLI